MFFDVDQILNIMVFYYLIHVTYRMLKKRFVSYKKTNAYLLLPDPHFCNFPPFCHQKWFSEQRDLFCFIPNWTMCCTPSQQHIHKFLPNCNTFFQLWYTHCSKVMVLMEKSSLLNKKRTLAFKRCYYLSLDLLYIVMAFFARPSEICIWIQTFEKRLSVNLSIFWQSAKKTTQAKMMISYVSFLFWIYDNCPCLYFNKEYDASVYKNKKSQMYFIS